MKIINFSKELDSLILKESAHSRQYVDRGLKKFWHQFRLLNILNGVNKIIDEKQIKTTIDLGSSDALITLLLNNRYPNLSATASDFKKYPVLHVKEDQYLIIDLNSEPKLSSKYDLVTCFETLEHVGSLERAIENIAKLLSNDGIFFVTVPIETGIWGLGKTLPKLFNKNYKFDEINCSKLKYLVSILIGKSRFKRKKLNHFGYHFGFDHTILLDVIKSNPSLYLINSSSKFGSCTIMGGLK